MLATSRRPRSTFSPAHVQRSRGFLLPVRAAPARGRAGVRPSPGALRREVPLVHGRHAHLEAARRAAAHGAEHADERHDRDDTQREKQKVTVALHQIPTSTAATGSAAPTATRSLTSETTYVTAAFARSVCADRAVCCVASTSVKEMRPFANCSCAMRADSRASASLVLGYRRRVLRRSSPAHRAVVTAAIEIDAAPRCSSAPARPKPICARGVVKPSPHRRR